jgi:hypothetical protein
MSLGMTLRMLWVNQSAAGWLHYSGKRHTKTHQPMAVQMQRFLDIRRLLIKRYLHAALIAGPAFWLSVSGER